MAESTIKIVYEDPELGTESGRFNENIYIYIYIYIYIFIYLGSLKNAFVHFYKHLVGLDGCHLKGLDGCHLKGLFGGQLLTTIGVDANDGMYPIIWAIVESETTQSWKWLVLGVFEPRLKDPK